MATPTATTRTRTPDLMSSPVAADALVAELLEHADDLHRQAAAQRLGANRVMAARERSVRLHARQIADAHDLDVDTAYRAPEHGDGEGGQ